MACEHIVRYVWTKAEGGRLFDRDFAVRMDAYFKMEILSNLEFDEK